MHNFVDESNCKIINEDVKSLIIENGYACGVVTTAGNKFRCDKVVVATGGKSYPLTGSTGQGYVLARQAGHTIVAPKPSLVPIVSKTVGVKNCRDYH